MPAYTVELMHHALNSLSIAMKGTKIGVLGISYKANVDDVRESPTFKILALLDEHGAKYETFDPHILKKSSIKNLESLLKKVDALIIATDHKEFKEIDPKIFKKNKIKVIIDGKNCLDKDAIKKLGIIYKGIGR